MINSAEPNPATASNAGFNVLRSAKIKAALIGTIKIRWVYSSARSASPKVLDSGCQPTTSETAHRSANCRDGDSLVIAFEAAAKEGSRLYSDNRYRTSD